jgi:hypothetical protein
MSFMEMQILSKAETVTFDCAKCGHTKYFHPETMPFALDEMKCSQCVSGDFDVTTRTSVGKMYAGRYSAAGYMDCTDWSYNANLRKLEKELRDMYGSD